MVTHRPYREALSVGEAITEIEHMSGTQFDPKVVTAFAELKNKERIMNLMKEVANGTKDRDQN